MRVGALRDRRPRSRDHGGRPDRDHARRVVAPVARSAGAALRDRPHDRDRRGGGRRGRARGRGRCERAGRGRRFAQLDRRGVPGPARPPRGGRRGAGHVGARRRAVRGGGRARIGRRDGQGACRRSCSRPRASRWFPTRSCASPSGRRTPRASRRGSPVSGSRSSRSPPRSARPSASRRSTIRTSCRPVWTRRSGTRGRPWWRRVSRASARSSARCWATTTRSRRSRGRSCLSGTSSTTTRRSTWTNRAHSC